MGKSATHYCTTVTVTASTVSQKKLDHHDFSRYSSYWSYGHYAGSLVSIRCIVLSLWSKDVFLIWEPLETI